MQTTTRIATGAIGLAGLLAASGIGLTSASAQQARATGKCGPTYGYIDAISATDSPSGVLVHGRRTTLHCGGPDDSSYVTHEKITLTMATDGTATVWKVPADPNGGTKTVPATALPHWLKRNRSEPIYKIHGPHSAVTSLVEQWHP